MSVVGGLQHREMIPRRLWWRRRCGVARVLHLVGLGMRAGPRTEHARRVRRNLTRARIGQGHAVGAEEAHVGIGHGCREVVGEVALPLSPRLRPQPRPRPCPWSLPSWRVPEPRPCWCPYPPCSGPCSTARSPRSPRRVPDGPAEPEELPEGAQPPVTERMVMGSSSVAGPGSPPQA